MIRVPQSGVWMLSHTSAPSCMASVSRKELLHTKGAERGFSEGARGHNSLARRCGEVPGILGSPFLFFTLLPASLSSPCTQDIERVQASCLAATRDQFQESEENNNKIEEKPQASSRSSILGHSVLSVSHAVVSCRKKSPIRLQRKREREVPNKRKVKKKTTSKSCKNNLKNKPRPFEAALHPSAI